MQLIKIDNVSKIYKTGSNENEVLKDVNLEIRAGENISIIGPSGSGKSTLLNIMGLLSLPTGGSITVAGQDTKKMSEKDKAALRNSCFGYISQDFALMEDETVFENVEIPLLYNRRERYTKRARALKVRETLARVGIAEKMNDKAKTLSGGQRQRVAIARALINSPKILLCDEPTGSLDKKTGSEIIDLLMSVSSKSGKAMVLVTHDLELAKRCEVQTAMRDKNIVNI